MSDRIIVKERGEIRRGTRDSDINGEQTKSDLGWLQERVYSWSVVRATRICETKVITMTSGREEKWTRC